MIAAVLAIFLCGIVNFALHKAVLESGHPLLLRLPLPRGVLGGRISLVLEFLMLLGAMLLAGEGMAGWAAAYGLYTGLNALSAWLILSGRV